MGNIVTVVDLVLVETTDADASVFVVDDDTWCVQSPFPMDGGVINGKDIFIVRYRDGTCRCVRDEEYIYITMKYTTCDGQEAFPTKPAP